VPSDDLLDGVDEHRAAQRSKRASDRPCETDLSQERDASSGIAGNRRSVPEDEPPALVPRLFGHVCEQAAGLIIGEWQKSQLVVSVEPGDDTRRPPAELSGPGVEQNRARQTRDRRIVGVRAASHPAEPTSSTFPAASRLGR
jgi:hypothetical protein